MHSIRVFGAPGRYIQGAGAIDRMGEQLARLGKRAALIADETVLDLFGARVLAACSDAGIHCDGIAFSGEITPEEIERLVGEIQGLEVDFVIGAGGGKGIDCGKGVAHRLGKRVVTLPTAASNDAPTSKIYVLYDRAHRIVRVEHLPANPDIVVVDTAIIVTAPTHLFTAGIGDAISKKFEVAQCIASGGLNLFGGAACRAAAALAELCYDTLRERAVAALTEVRARRVSEDVERVIEATVLHSGLSFESGGLSIAHAMTRGLSAVRGARDCLHGHQVAFGLLVQLTLEQRPEAFIDDVCTFFRQVELPIRLAQLRLDTPTEDDIEAIARGTMTASYIRNFQRSLTARDVAAAVRSVEARTTAL